MRIERAAWAPTASALAVSGLAVLATAWLAFATPGWSQEPDADVDADATGIVAADHAFVEVVASRERFFVHEPIRLRLRVGYDAVFFRDHAIQLFRRSLDLPVQVLTGGLEELPGTRESDGTTAGNGGAGAGAGAGAGNDGDARGASSGAGADRRSEAPRLTLALDDGIATAYRIADENRDGRTFAVVEIEKRYLPIRVGEIEVPAPRLRFAWATRFEESFIGGRTPLDRYDAEIAGTPLSLTVEAVPETGRPASFTGAVGSFTISAKAEPREVTAGDTLTLELRIEGDGDLSVFDAPRLSDLEGFHVYGHIEEQAPGARIFAYDIAPLSGRVRSVPPVEFSFFEPGPQAAYRTVTSEAIPLTVEPGPDEPGIGDPTSGGPASGGAGAGDSGSGDSRSGESRSDDAATNDESASAAGGGQDTAPGNGDEARNAEDGSSGDGALLQTLLRVGLALLVAVILIQVIRSSLRDRAGRKRSEGGTASAPRVEPARPSASARHAADEFRSSSKAADADLAGNFAAYLAARLHCPPPAVVDPQLAARLREAGVEDELAGRTADFVEGAYAARYGGKSLEHMDIGASCLVDELETAFSNGAH